MDLWGETVGSKQAAKEEKNSASRKYRRPVDTDQIGAPEDRKMGGNSKFREFLGVITRCWKR